MRGDSVRDLYAKTLALLGLGMLAGTGALVDYWPASNVAMPVAEPVLAAPEVAWATPPAAPVLPALPVLAVGPIAAQMARISPPVSVAAAPPMLSVTPAAAFVAEQVALATPPQDVLTPVSWTDSPQHTEVALSDVDEFQPVATAKTHVAMNGSGGDEDDWWITAAAKRTGSSIARTGVWTGASVVDLFRAVNRVVRRALPN